MIIWINGAFGSGKTTCAFELQRRLPNSYVYDPENIGFFLNQNLPKTMRERDFQNYEQWRLFNYEMLSALEKKHDGIIIVPMTITNRQYYDEIIGRLMQDEISVHHFILYAQKETLVRRLNKRLEFGHGWGKKQIDRCIYAFDHDIHEEKIFTDNMSIDEIIESIAERANINLQVDNRTKFKKWLDRTKITVDHIRS